VRFTSVADLALALETAQCQGRMKLLTIVAGDAVLTTGMLDRRVRILGLTRA